MIFQLGLYANGGYDNGSRCYNEYRSNRVRCR